MAIWDSATLNTNALSSAINKWADRNFIPAIVKNNGLLYAMLGRTEKGPATSGSGQFKREKVSGLALNVRMLGELESFSGLADANQADTVTPSWNTNAFGAATFAWTHMYYKEWLVESELKLIKGDEAKTASFLEDVMTKVRRSWEATIGDGINSASDAARTTIGGWRWAVSDGSSSYGSESTYNVYGGISRTANAFFQSNITNVAGDLTLEHLESNLLDCYQDGGNPTVGVCGKTPYAKLLQELRGYTLYDDDTWNKFGGSRIGFRNVMYTFDHRGDDTSLGHLDPNGWTLYMDEDGITSAGLVDARAYTKGAPYVLPLDMWLANICKAPVWQGKCIGITG